jgi:murein DD-endopeptidase MepM/ murein hydrolase activator NlpD
MPVSIGEVQARIGHIHTMMLTAATGAVPTTAATRTAGAGGAAGGTAAASGTEFAAALQEALATEKAGAVSPAAGAPGNSWIRPAQGTVSSEYGPRWGTEHEGIDIAAGSGSAIRAAGDGVVKKASWYGGYGNAVIIDHGKGVQTLYGHASKLDVREGERVRAGQVIAKVGSTGDSTGPHLHFEVELDGKKVDPRPWMKNHGVSF